MPEPVFKPVGFRKPSEVVGQEAIDKLNAAGWEVVRKTTETRRRDRAAAASMRAYWAEQDRNSAMSWGRNLSKELRHLRDRCTFLYLKAQELGATVEDLRAESGETRKREAVS